MAPTNNFGIALRGWRERLSPLAGGLESAADRRIPGLRREELARLAGVSVDYVVRLEQGRARNPSAQVVTALARALRLDTSERDHLFRCANLAPPSGGAIPMHVPPGVHRLVQQLGDAPVGVYAADWTLVSWNRMWTAAIGDPRTYDWDRGNLVAGMFRSSGGHRVDSIAAWPVRSWAGDEAEEESLVADLRVTAAAYPDDARLTLLVDRLLHTSPRFARLWSNGSAGLHAGDRKTIEHPVVGDLTLDLDVLMVPGSDLRIVVYTAVAGTDDAENLDALRAACYR
ncbi:helix-turn-helix transcriptional regulator [Streptantibioticus ferralitis]|uniref:Helix-turn-helix transcriptional regulator n=1 Tax=Streptantibioticus ferralitis TaxID=236510 RepID=A0ABT5Z120_9ACTN|nr:helix-turn-helix transcriptional regulator [Streptantibioticus ferralitis]MDF2257510.1 helix-turn-helix transcriptional regulator [Streptantibioticus ferralitis]